MFERSAMKKLGPKPPQTTVSPANVAFDRMFAAAELANPYNDF